MNADVPPPVQGALAAAVQWLESALLGSVATTVAVIAVSCVGLLMLSGRVDVRRGAQVIFGCFILFGASSIAGGIVRALGDAGSAPEIAAPPPAQPAYAPAAAKPPGNAVPYDPYAGAALPSRP